MGWKPVIFAALLALSSRAVTGTVYTLGNAPVDREDVDDWANAIFIPNPNDTVQEDGFITSWEFYARRTGEIRMMVLRLNGTNNDYVIVGQTVYDVNCTGKQGGQLNTNLPVKKGDVLGFYFPDYGMVPFDGVDCYPGQALYYQPAEGVRVGEKYCFKQRSFQACAVYSVRATVDTAKSLTHGEGVVDREYLDGWSNTILIVNPRDPIKTDGQVTSWEFYARRSGRIYLQVFRRVSGYLFRIIGQTEYTVTQSGPQYVKIRPGSEFSVQSGDLLGFYFPGQSIIPFDGRECYTSRAMYVKSPYSVRVGRSFYFRSKQSGWDPCRKYSLKAYISEKEVTTTPVPTNPVPTTSAAVTSLPLGNWYHGDEPKYRSSLDGWSNAMFILNPSDPISQSGRIVNWQLFARRSGSISLLVFRRTRGYSRYMLISKTSYSSSSGYNEVQPSGPIPVERGDLLGIYFPGQSIVPFDGRECYTGRTLYVKSPRYVNVGSSYYFSTKQSGWSPCRKYSLRAQLAPAAGRTLPPPATRPPTTRTPSTTVWITPEEPSTAVWVTPQKPSTTAAAVTPLPVGNWYHGEEPKYRSTLDNWSNAMFIVNPSDTISRPGEIVKWEYYARNNGAISLLVFRKASGYRRYTLLSKTSSVSRYGYNEVQPNRFISVKRGDLIGIYFPGQSIIPFDGLECYSSRTLYVRSPSSVTVGSSYYFSTKQSGWRPCRKYSVRAQLAPEEDNTTESGEGESGSGSGNNLLSGSGYEGSGEDQDNTINRIPFMPDSE